MADRRIFVTAARPCDSSVRTRQYWCPKDNMFAVGNGVLCDVIRETKKKKKILLLYLSTNYFMYIIYSVQTKGAKIMMYLQYIYKNLSAYITNTGFFLSCK